MIIFSPNPQLVENISYKFPNRKISIFNLSSCYSGYIDITMLAKLSCINETYMSMPAFVNSLEFDLQYASNIINLPHMFNDFMKVMSSAFEGDLVIILVYRDPYRDAIMESLIKLIQQRYGYNCWIIEDKDDIESIREEQFIPYGLINLENDLRKYDQLYRDISNQISVE